MDDYFETGRAERLLVQARRQSPEFLAIALVHALVVAQIKIAADWCDVFRGPRDTLARYFHGLEMRRLAVDIVLDYTDRYGKTAASGGHPVLAGPCARAAPA